MTHSVIFIISVSILHNLYFMQCVCVYAHKTVVPVILFHFIEILLQCNNKIQLLLIYMFSYWYCGARTVVLSAFSICNSCLLLLLHQHFRENISLAYLKFIVLFGEFVPLVSQCVYIHFVLVR